MGSRGEGTGTFRRTTNGIMYRTGGGIGSRKGGGGPDVGLLLACYKYSHTARPPACMHASSFYGFWKYFLHPPPSKKKKPIGLEAYTNL